MRPVREPVPGPKAPPYAVLRERMMDAAAAVEAAGQGEAARKLREAVEDWWRSQQMWNEHLGELFGVHHEINNALVGIRGNAQLVQRSPVAKEPGVQERMEVVIRESQRIQEAVGRLRDAKIALGGQGPASRAA